MTSLNTITLQSSVDSLVFAHNRYIMYAYIVTLVTFFLVLAVDFSGISGIFH